MSLDIGLTAYLVPYEAAGEACHECGDTIYLGGKRVVIDVGGERMDTEFVYCAACASDVE